MEFAVAAYAVLGFWSWRGIPVNIPRFSLVYGGSRTNYHRRVRLKLRGVGYFLAWRLAIAVLRLCSLTRRTALLSAPDWRSQEETKKEKIDSRRIITAKKQECLSMSRAKCETSANTLHSIWLAFYKKQKKIIKKQKSHNKILLFSEINSIVDYTRVLNLTCSPC